MCGMLHVHGIVRHRSLRRVHGILMHLSHPSTLGAERCHRPVNPPTTPAASRGQRRPSTRESHTISFTGSSFGGCGVCVCVYLCVCACVRVAPVCCPSPAPPSCRSPHTLPLTLSHQVTDTPGSVRRARRLPPPCPVPLCRIAGTGRESHLLVRVVCAESSVPFHTHTISHENVGHCHRIGRAVRRRRVRVRSHVPDVPAGDTFFTHHRDGA